METTAATYCRVSTKDQEREGTSLDSQQEACLKAATEQGYQVSEEHVLREVWSGLTLDRPEITRLRDWVRNKEVDAVIVYSTDRLSRDPLHLLLLAEEFDKAKVSLIFVTEPLDNSMEGQLLGFVRGWASKLEAVKIRERTMRGKLQKAKSGTIPGNSHARLYGYRYIPFKEGGTGVRLINEDQAQWVKEMFRWLVEEQMSTNAIVRRLRSLNAPTPSGDGFWIKRTVQKILRNLAYCGRTYAFTLTYGEPRRRLKPDAKRAKTGIIRKPKEEWVEIPGATPAIISEDLFEAAQKQLERNKELSLRNADPDNRYLLRGHIRCSKCGGSFWAFPGIKTRGGRRYKYPFYTCQRNLNIVSPTKCGNPRISASRIEPIVWEQVESILTKPELVVHEIRRRQEQLEDITVLQNGIERIDLQLSNRDKQKDRIWQAFRITGDEETFKKNIQDLDKEVSELLEEKSQMEKRLADNQNKPNLEDIEKACALVCQNASDLSFEDKRLALEALQVKVWVDGNKLTVEGAIPIPVGHIEGLQPGWHPPVPRQGS